MNNPEAKTIQLRVVRVCGLTDSEATSPNHKGFTATTWKRSLRIQYIYYRVTFSEGLTCFNKVMWDHKSS